MTAHNTRARTASNPDEFKEAREFCAAYAKALKRRYGKHRNYCHALLDDEMHDIEHRLFDGPTHPCIEHIRPN